MTLLGGGGSETLSKDFRGQSLKEHLDWLKTDLNAAKITTVQDYKCAKH